MKPKQLELGVPPTSGSVPQDVRQIIEQAPTRKELLARERGRIARQTKKIMSVKEGDRVRVRLCGAWYEGAVRMAGDVMLVARLDDGRSIHVDRPEHWDRA